ncbi:MAG: HTH-type sugar sensing transcriptional regulator TrmB [Halobaculum sp.]
MDEDLRQELTRLGERFDFGEYETAAYLAVLERGELTAAEIAEQTQIPQPRVYDTVRGLAADGLVELRESRPMRVAAVDPSEAFASVRSSLDTVVEGLERRYTNPDPPEEAVTLVSSRQTVLRYLERVITSAEYELVLSLTPDLLARFESALADRREAGVATELVLAPARDVPAADDYDYDRIATAARARRGVTTPVAGVADGRRSVYTSREAVTADDGYGIVFDRSELGFLVAAFLDTAVWPSADPLLESSDGRAFPRRYASVRRCVQDLDPLPDGLAATVRGRDVETGERRTVAGDVVAVTSEGGRETAAITLEAGSERVRIGGQVAAIEDVEAQVIVVGRGDPPAL